MIPIPSKKRRDVGPAHIEFIAARDFTLSSPKIDDLEGWHRLAAGASYFVRSEN
jgi:hypothetical protein